MTAALTMTCGEVAVALNYLKRDATPNRAVIRNLVGKGNFPPPIDPTLSYALWRWSRAEVEAYAAGEWTPKARAS